MVVMRWKTEGRHKGDIYAGKMPSMNLGAQYALATINIISIATVINRIRKKNSGPKGKKPIPATSKTFFLSLVLQVQFHSHILWVVLEWGKRSSCIIGTSLLPIAGKQNKISKTRTASYF